MAIGIWLDKYLGKEKGGGDSGGAFVANAVDGTLDKTWREIYTAMSGGQPCFIKKARDDGQIDFDFVENINEFELLCIQTSYMADSEDDYPTEE